MTDPQPGIASLWIAFEPPKKPAFPPVCRCTRPNAGRTAGAQRWPGPAPRVSCFLSCSPAFGWPTSIQVAAGSSEDEQALIEWRVEYEQASGAWVMSR